MKGKSIGRKLKIFLVVVIAAAFVLPQSPQSIVFADSGDSGSGSETPATDIKPLTKPEGDLIQYVNFGEPVLSTIKVPYKGEILEFTRVSLGNCIRAGIPGHPELPVYIAKLALPPYTKPADVRVIPLDQHVIKLDDKKPVFPYQAPLPVGTPPPEEIEWDLSAYSSPGLTDLLFGGGTKVSPFSREGEKPTVIRTGWDLGYCRGYPILSVNIRPVRYDPVENILVYHKKVLISVELEQTSQLNRFYRNNPVDRWWVKNLVLNDEIVDSYPNLPPLEYEGGLCDPSEHYDYVIITTEENGLDHWERSSTLPYNWTDLMEKHETEDGLRCTLVTVEDIDACSDYWNSTPLFNDTQAHIREFCRDAYQDWGTQYVLIAGDADTIPARLMSYAYESNIDADIYWSNLDKTFNADQDNQWGEEGDAGFDLYSELWIGRITCDEPKDVSNWMEKSFYYADCWDRDWLDNVAGYGGDTGWNAQGDDFIDFTLWGTSNWLGPNPGAHGAYPDWLGFLWGFDTWNENNPGSEFNVSVLWTAEPPNPGWQGGSEAQAVAGMRDDINHNNCTLIFGVAHANEHMSLDVYDTDWATQYHNTRPFFLHDYGCHCGDFDAADDGVVDVMLFHSNRSLAFACVYNTGYGWGSFDDTNSSSALQQKLFLDWMLNISKSGGPMNWQLGKAHAASKDEMAPTINWTYSGAPGSWRGIIEGCTLFGDPAQKIKPPVMPEHNVGVQKIDVRDHEPASTTIYVNATVYNNGKHNETNVHVNFMVYYSNGTLKQQTTQIIPFFEKQTIQHVSFTYTTPSGGWETLCISVSNVPDDEISYDNEKCKDVIYGPDIAVTSIQAPDYLARGFARPVTATICNVGPTDESNIEIQLIANGTVVNTTYIDLNSGECTTVTFMWDATISGVGTYNVTVYAVPVPDESYLKNQNKSHMVEVFEPKGSILLVDDDYDEDQGKDMDYEKYYEIALYKDHWNVEIWDTHDNNGPPSASYMAQYNAVVWETGDNGRTVGWYYYPALTYSERYAIQTYLTNYNGKLFISGQGIAYDAYYSGWTSWLRTYLHADFVTDYANDWFVDGVPGDPIGNGLALEISSGDGARNQVSQDGISPYGSMAYECFRYHTAPYSAGVRYMGAYKTVFFAFGFEAINNADDRLTVMHRILDWMIAEHDMAAIELSVPDYVDPSLGTTVIGKIINGGMHTESNIWMNFTAEPLVNGTYYEYNVHIDSMAPGQIHTESWTWGPPVVAGIYNVSVEVWQENDTIPIDDKITKTVIVGPDIQVDSYSIIYHGESGDTRVYLEEEHDVVASITNLGVVDVTNLEIQLKVDHVVVDSVIIPELDGGETTTVILHWTPHTTGWHLVQVYSVPVKDEYVVDNNIYSTNQIVAAVPRIWTNPEEINIEINQGMEGYNPILFGNNGTAPLEYTVFERAPGIRETFDKPFPPPGWQVIDYIPGRPPYYGTWGTTTYSGRGMIAYVYYNYYEYSDTALIAPLDCRGVSDVIIKFDQYIYNYYGTGTFDFDISLDNGVTWININSYDTTGGWVRVTEDISDYADGKQVLVRWHFTNEGDTYNYCYWRLDNIWAGSERTVGTVYSEDFEADDGGYTGEDEWEWGEPTYGPSGAHSGSYCWGTDLDSHYDNSANEALYSIEIDLTDVSGTPYLTFWQWYEIENYWDGGNVKISTDGGNTWSILYPTDGYPGVASSSNQGIPGEPCYTGYARNWHKVSFSLADYVGEHVMIKWHFGSDGSVYYAGWYIDDVAVEILDIQEVLVENFDSPWPPEGWQIVDYLPSSGTYGTWSRTTSSGRGYVARAYYWYYHETDTALIAPLDARAMRDVRIGFEHYYYNYYGTADLYFDISIDGGNTWINIAHWGQGYQPWTPEYFDISEYADGKKVLIRWRAHNQGDTYNYFYWYLDNVYTEGSPVGIDTIPGGGTIHPGDTTLNHVETIATMPVGDYHMTFVIDSNDPHRGRSHLEYPMEVKIYPIPHQVGVADGGIEPSEKYYVFDTYETFATVENHGTTDETVEVQLLADGNVVASTTVFLPATRNELNPFAEPSSQEVTFDWTPTEKKTYTLTVRAVPVDGETFLYDNEVSFEVTVVGKPDIDVTPLSLEFVLSASHPTETKLLNIANIPSATGDLLFNAESTVVSQIEAEFTPSVPDTPYGSAVGDLDGDGIDEVAFGAGHYICHVYIYDYNTNTGEYEMVWDKNWPYEDPMIEAIHIGDCDNDGQNELLVGGGDIHIISYNATTGTYEEEATITETDGQLSCVYTADTDGDGLNEIYACNILTYGPSYQWWFKYNETTGQYDIQDKQATGGTYGLSQLTVPVGDIDNDGVVEQMVGGYDLGGAAILHWDPDAGKYVQECFFTFPGGIYDACSGGNFADVDGDGQLEIVCSFAYSGSDGVHMLEYDGHDVEDVDVYNKDCGNVIYEVAAFDYDNDGDVEAMVCSDGADGYHLLALGWDNDSREWVLEKTWSYTTGYLDECPMIAWGNTDLDPWTEFAVPLSYHQACAILQCPPAWLTVEPTEGTLAPGENMNLNVNVNATGFVPGTYHEGIIITSNDPDEDYIYVPVTVNFYYDNDVGAIDVGPTGTLPAGEIIPTAVVKNFGYNDQTNVQVRFTATPGGAPVTVLSEDFGSLDNPSGIYPYGDWHVYNHNNPYTGWGLYYFPDDPSNLFAGHVDELAPCDDWLVSPEITIPQGATLYFDEMNYYMGWYEEHALYLIYGEGDPNDCEKVFIQEFDEDVGYEWTTRIVDLSAYAGETVRLGFHYAGYYASQWFIDNILLTGFEMGPSPGEPYEGYITVDLLSQESKEVTFPVWNAVPGVYNIRAETMLPGDENPYNDYIEGVLTIIDVVPPTSWILPEDIEMHHPTPDTIITLDAMDDYSDWQIHYIVDGGEEQVGDINTAVHLGGFEYGEHTIEFWAVDTYGNEEPHHVVTFYVMLEDLVTPALKFDGPYELIDGVWEITTDTKILFDPDILYMNGIAEVYYGYHADEEENVEEWFLYTEPFTMPAGYYHILYYGVDELGRYTPTARITVNVVAANHAPVTTITLTPSSPDGNDGWYRNLVKVTLHAVDLDGDEVTTYYRIDDGEWKVYTGTFTIGDGIHTIYYKSVDSRGKEETVKSKKVKVDIHPPTIYVSSPTKGTLYLFGREIIHLPIDKAIILGAITIEATAQDLATSGMASMHLYIDEVIRDTGTETIRWTWNEFAIGKHTITIEAYDVAGNKALTSIETIAFNLAIS